MKSGDIRMSQDLPHLYRETPDIAPSFNVQCIGVMIIWCLQMLLLIEIEVYGII